MEILTNVPAVMLLIGSFLVMIALRMPIVFAIGLSSIATAFYLGLPLQMVAQNWSRDSTCSSCWPYLSSC